MSDGAAGSTVGVLLILPPSEAPTVSVGNNAPAVEPPPGALKISIDAFTIDVDAESPRLTPVGNLIDLLVRKV